MSLYTAETRIRIPFFDVDPMNIVWHGNYVRYMEQARCDMFLKLGYTYMDMKQDGYSYPVAKMSTKFIHPISFDDEIIIKTELQTIEPVMNIKYIIINEKTGQKIFTGETMQIAINSETFESSYYAPVRLKEIIDKLNEKQTV